MPKTAVSARNTKQELLDAYDQLVKELEKQDQQSNSSPVNTPPTATPSKSVSIEKPEEIVQAIGKLRVTITEHLGMIVDQLVEESEKLERLRHESQTIQQEIHTLHQIKVEATTLHNLLKLKNEEEQRLNQQIAQLRQEWENEQRDHDKSLRDEKFEQETQRKRENEEYLYQLKIKRQQDEETYKTKRKIVEEELATRALELKQKEEEFVSLNQTVKVLEKKLETEIIKVRTETTREITRELETKYNLEKKETEGERKLSQLTISNLQKTITAQEAEIMDLKTKLDRATAQIKDIAISVIEVQKPTTAVVANQAKISKKDEDE